MRFQILLLLVLVTALCETNAQQWDWADHLNYGGTTSGSSIGGTDAEGNTYIVTMVSSDDHLNPWNGYVLLKVDRTGQKVWTKNINQYFQGRMTTDLNGNIYIAYADKLTCIDKNGSETWQVNSNGVRAFGKVYLSDNYLLVDGTDFLGDTTKGFVAKYTYAGSLLNTVYYYIPKFSKCTLDKEENFILVSDDLPDSTTKNRDRLSLFNKSGQLNFKRETPHKPSQIICDKDNNVLIAGWHDIFPIQIKGIEYKTPGNFIVKYSPQGQLLWYKIIEGSLGASRMTCDKEGNLYYVVDFSTHIKIGEFELNHATGGLLVIKYDADGNEVWHQFTSSYNTGPFGYLQPESVYAGEDGDIYLSGRISGQLLFGNSLLTTSSDMYTELFVGKISQKNVVGVTEPESFASLWQVFPNPSGDIFTISGEEEKEVQFIITDVRGQLIKTEFSAESRTSIDLSPYAKGVYFVQIRSGGKTETKKLVKN
jgi:hypothetical protein